MMRKFSFILFLFFLLCDGPLWAQLSKGGIPRVPLVAKSASLPRETLPEVSNEFLLWQSMAEREEDAALGKLKPLRFAHSFATGYTPATHGTWAVSADGWQIWQLTLHSPGALSLNVIFSQFSLPGNARLFLFTPGQEQIRGAYTSANNDPGGVFATTPLPGDIMTIQYECPAGNAADPPFVISSVNHDFLGILKFIDERRPMGVTAEACNIDVNCQAADRWREVQNSVCRIMVEGRDLCTGTLLNNSAADQRPYIITANHCISTATKAQGSLFLFNYESPFCGPLDGDVTNSLSGSRLRATLDSLDFALVELNTPPPPSFRPYYAGWNRDPVPADTIAAIHHPQGDIKKVAIDDQAAVSSSFLSSFRKNSFWKVLRWDAGTTEIGSSGCGLFNRQGQLTGTLSGGAANCSNPVNDYFARFDLAWNYRGDSTRQLKYWLDPARTNPLSVNGKQFNQGEELSKTFTPLREGDAYTLLAISGAGAPWKGYWTGTNNTGITEIASKFSIPGKEMVHSVALGVGKIKAADRNSSIALRFYNLQGTTVMPFSYEKTIALKSLVPDAMNLVFIDPVFMPGDSFLVALNLENISPGDTLALFQTIRTSGPENLFLLKNGLWTNFSDLFPDGSFGALALEIAAFNAELSTNDTLTGERPEQILVYPNPAISHITVRSSELLLPEMVSLCTLTGQNLPVRVTSLAAGETGISMDHYPPGIYLLIIKWGKGYSRHKIVLTSR